MQLEATWNTFVTNVIAPLNQTLADTITAQVDWNLWVNVPGYPPIQANFSNPDATAAMNLADAYINAQGQSSPSNYLDFNTYYANQ